MKRLTPALGPRGDALQADKLQAFLAYNPDNSTRLGLDDEFGWNTDVFENCPPGPMMFPHPTVMTHLEAAVVDRRADA